VVLPALYFFLSNIQTNILWETSSDWNTNGRTVVQVEGVLMAGFWFGLHHEKKKQLMARKRT
jgi:hypothetical protein